MSNSYVLIDEKINKKYERYLKSIRKNVIKIPKDYNLYDEIASHTDIHVLKIKEYVIADRRTYDFLQKYNIPNLLCGKSELIREYPGDIKYNVALVGNIALHSFNYTDDVVLEYLDRFKYTKIDINQGYTKCSTFILDNKNVITSNKEIAEKLIKNDINVLLLEESDEENIRLLRDGVISNMHGFIGGCMVRIDNKCILFGDASKLICGRKIRDFVERNNYQFIDFRGEEVIDYGGIVLI